jgi:hypothetical protein
MMNPTHSEPIMTRHLLDRLGLLGGAACIALAATALPVRVDLRHLAVTESVALADDDHGGRDRDRGDRSDDRGGGRGSDDHGGDHHGGRGGDDDDRGRGADDDHDDDRGRGRGSDDDHDDDRGRGRGWDDDGTRSRSFVKVIHKDDGRAVTTEYGSLQEVLDAMFGDDSRR